MNKQKIVIIGAGIVGACMAYHLAKRNQDVTVIERHSAAAREVTEKSFAWIHTTHRVAPEYWHLYDANCGRISHTSARVVRTEHSLAWCANLGHSASKGATLSKIKPGAA